MTTSALVAVSTASEASGGVEVGDLTLTITPAFEAKLKTFFEEVQAACGLVKLKPRVGESCTGGTARFINENLPEEIAAEVNNAVGTATGQELQNGIANLVDSLFNADLGAIVGGFEERLEHIQKSQV